MFVNSDFGFSFYRLFDSVMLGFVIRSFVVLGLVILLRVRVGLGLLVWLVLFVYLVCICGLILVYLLYVFEECEIYC